MVASLFITCHCRTTPEKRERWLTPC